jgi:hypothetical protein
MRTVLSLIRSLEAAYSGLMYRTSLEAERALKRELVQCKTQEDIGVQHRKRT